MQSTSVKWAEWADTLERFKIKTLSAWLLEVGEPLMPIGAQMLYIGQPFLNRDSVNNLARLLEDKEEVRAFAIFLRKE